MLHIITSLFLLLGEPTLDLCAANAVDPAAAVAASVMPLSAVEAPACKIVDFVAISKFNPATLRWVETGDLPIDKDLAETRTWLSAGQAHSWLDGGKTNQVVLVGSGIDDQQLAQRCGQMFGHARVTVLHGGMSTLRTTVPTITANEALTALLRASPNIFTLISSDQLPAELAGRLRVAGVKFSRAANAKTADSNAQIERKDAHGKQPLRFNIAGGLDALNAAYQQFNALALAPKNAPRRPCYFP